VVINTFMNIASRNLRFTPHQCVGRNVYKDAEKGRAAAGRCR